MDLKKTKTKKKQQQFLIFDTNEQKILIDLIKFTHFPLEFEKKASLLITLKLGSARSHNFIGQHCYLRPFYIGESF